MDDTMVLPDASVLEPQLITEDSDLRRLCEHWRTLPTLAMDTEFIRVDTFYPQLGLLQVCDGQGSYLLDPLELKDWDAFRALLRDDRITKVLHACSEDLLVFNEYFGVIPQPVFDTQKAAAFLGLGYSISYQNLVRELLGIEVDKGETRSDWLRRPLSKQQLHYAALDVAYLPAIHEQMRDRLVRSAHLQNLMNECEQMRMQAALTEDEQDWETLYLNMGAAWRLDRDQLAILRALSRWREREARRLNIPRPWVAKDSDLILLAQHAPVDRQALRGLDELGRAARDVDPQVLLEIMEEGRRHPIPDDAVPAGQPLSPAQRKTLKRCQTAVREIADQQGVAVELLARKKQLVSLLALARKPGWQWPDELGGWRRDLLEQPLRALLEGGQAAEQRESCPEQS